MERSMLRKLPHDLKATGWQWMASESKAIRRGAGTWYKAVFAQADRQSTAEVMALLQTIPEAVQHRRSPPSTPSTTAVAVTLPRTRTSVYPAMESCPARA